MDKLLPEQRVVLDVDFKLLEETKIKRTLKERKQWYNGTYLHSVHWLTLRRTIIQDSDKTCEICNRTSRRREVYQVHHVNYDNLCMELRKDVMLCCWKCHSKKHNKYKENG